MRNRPHRDNGEGQAGTPPVSYPRVETRVPQPLQGEIKGDVRYPGFGNPGLKSTIPLGLTSLVISTTATSRPFEDPVPGTLFRI